jgi:hypothetical protein
MPHFSILNRTCPRANVITGRGKSWIIGKLDNCLVWTRFHEKGRQSAARYHAFQFNI